MRPAVVKALLEYGFPKIFRADVERLGAFDETPVLRVSATVQGQHVERLMISS